MAALAVVVLAEGLTARVLVGTAISIVGVWLVIQGMGDSSRAGTPERVDGAAHQGDNNMTLREAL